MMEGDGTAIMRNGFIRSRVLIPELQRQHRAMAAAVGEEPMCLEMAASHWTPPA
jgi:hypothetical protein